MQGKDRQLENSEKGMYVDVTWFTVQEKIQNIFIFNKELNEIGCMKQ